MVGGITKGHEETLRGHGCYVHYLDCDGFREVCMPRLIKYFKYNLMYVNLLSIKLLNKKHVNTKLER